MLRLVFDSNVWVSGGLWQDSVPGQCIQAFRAEIITVVTSTIIVDEVKAVLHKPKIKKLKQRNQDKIDYLFAAFPLFTEILFLDHQEHVFPALNQQDSLVLQTLINSKAHYLVTGDADLLALHTEYPIITPKRCVELLYE